MRQGLVESMNQEVAALSYRDGRIEENTVAAVADSDELFRRPGGTKGWRGKWRGGRGLLIGVVGEPFPLRINKGEWGVIGGVGYQRGKGNRRRLGKPWHMGPTCQWAPLASGRERVPIRRDPGWAMGCFGVGPKRFPRGPFYVFPFFLSFLFLFSLFLHILFKFDSNWCIPKSKFF
jgi:hypothetical protein